MLTQNERYHEPVLLSEVLEHLGVKPGGIYLDCTAGTGGHLAEIAKRAGKTGFVIGCDLDAAALQIAEDRLQRLESSDSIAPWKLVHSCYTDIESVASLLPNGLADGILLDFGCSSLQLDTPERGFSFIKEGPLDMRFNPQSDSPSAADLIASCNEQELADIFYTLGDERRSRRIAARIVERREDTPITKTSQLREIVESVTGRRAGRISGATRVFQALRIAVNNELRNIETVLPIAYKMLSKGGCLVTITFHSLEDRIVKKFNKRLGSLESAKILTRKPVRAKDEELRRNPRSRSAMLRAIRKG